MSKKLRHLLLLRHAKSSWKSEAASDFERPLAKRGKEDASMVGFWLKRQQLIPDLILSSPAKRAQKTTLKVCGELGFDPDEIRWIPEIYDATLIDLVKAVKSCPDKFETVLIVGHNPGIEFLLSYLCKDPLPFREDGKLMTTACVAHLVMPVKWSEIVKAVARLKSITRPAQMG